MRERLRYPDAGVSGFLVVVVLGLMCHYLDVAVGANLSIRIPETDRNVIVGAGFGKKDRSRQTVPEYISSRIGSSQDDFGTSFAIPILTIEGFATLGIGKVPEVPEVDINAKISGG